MFYFFFCHLSLFVFVTKLNGANKESYQNKVIKEGLSRE